jgi:hypothetical protein
MGKDCKPACWLAQHNTAQNNFRSWSKLRDLKRQKWPVADRMLCGIGAVLALATFVMIIQELIK